MRDHFLDEDYHSQAQPLVVKIASEFPIASKPYRCLVCDGEIAKGEKHERLIWRDGEALDRRRSLRTARLHLKCPPMEYL